MGPPIGHPIHPPGALWVAGGIKCDARGEGGGALIVVATLSENDGSFDKLSAGSALKQRERVLASGSFLANQLVKVDCQSAALVQTNR